MHTYQKSDFSLFSLLLPLFVLIFGLMPSIFKPQPVFSKEYDNLIVFGDSLSDSGNIKRKLNQDYPPNPPYYNQRFSNGSVYSELISKYLNITIHPDLNYAYGGAFTDNNNLNQSIFPFLSNTGVQSQITEYLSSGKKASSNDLFVIYGGANDYFSTLASLTPGDPNAPSLIKSSIQKTLGNLANSAIQLITVGNTKQIVFPNLPNFGKTPQFNTDLTASTTMGLITKGHNDGLAIAAQRLASSLNAHVYIVDFASLFNDIHNNPDKYGFSNTTQACIAVIECLTDPKEQEKFLFYDSVHPTTKAHDLAARFFSDTIISPYTIPALAEYNAQLAQAHLHKLSSVFMEIPHRQQKRISVFLDADYFSNSKDANISQIGYEYNSWFLSLGIMHHIEKKITFGLMASLSDGEVDYNRDLGGFDALSYRLMAFIQSRAPWKSQLRIAFAGSKDEYEIKRKTRVANQIARSKPDGSSLYALIELRKPFTLDSFSLTPFIRAQYTDVKRNAYQETGATGLNLLIEKTNLDPAELKLGTNLGIELYKFKWNLEGLWSVGLSNDKQNIRSRLVSVPGLLRSFESNGLDQNYAQFTTSLTYHLRSGLGIQFGGNIMIARKTTNPWSLFLRFTKSY